MRIEEWGRRQERARTNRRGGVHPDLMEIGPRHRGLEQSHGVSVTESDRLEARPSFREGSGAERALLLEQIISISGSWGESSVIRLDDGVSSTAFGIKGGAPVSSLLGRDAPFSNSKTSHEVSDAIHNQTHHLFRASLLAISTASSSSAQIRLAQAAAPVQSGLPVNLTYFNSRPIFDLLAVAFVTPKYGVAVGLVGQMMYTKTGGVSWEYTFSPTLFDLFAIDSITCMTMSTVNVPASTISSVASSSDVSQWSDYFFPKQIVPLTLASMCPHRLPCS